MGDEGKLDYKVPGNRTLRLALFWSKDFFGGRDQAVIATARKMLGEHSMNLQLWPDNGQQSPDRTFDFGKGVIQPDQHWDIFSKLNDICAAAGKERSHLITLFCQFQMPASGLTIIDTSMGCLVRPMIFIAPTPAGGDMVTILHEAGHAAGLNHDRTSSKPTGRNFMNEAETRSTMMKWQLQKLCTAFFVA